MPEGDALPANIAGDLIAAGIRTIISFNGEQYELNKEEEQT